MTYIVLYEGRIFNFIESEIQPEFTSHYLVLDGDKYDIGSLKEGYLYDEKTDTFIESEFLPPQVEVVEEEVDPTPEEIQEQLLLTSEYNSILLETLLG